MKTFLITSKFGDSEFAFNAVDKDSAFKKLCKWATYHSFSGADFGLEDITGTVTNLLHNEYVS